MITVTVHNDLIILKGRGEDAEKLASFKLLELKDQGAQTNLKGGYREKVYHLVPVATPVVAPVVAPVVTPEPVQVQSVSVKNTKRFELDTE